MALIVELVNLVDLVGIVTRADSASDAGEKKKKAESQNGIRRIDNVSGGERRKKSGGAVRASPLGISGKGCIQRIICAVPMIYLPVLGQVPDRRKTA